jgi:preprotein translocase subunit SecY
VKFDVATLLVQLAAGGLFFCWITTRRREVGLGYGWLLRIVFGVLAALAIGRIVPGRAGYWIDLGLIMFGLYLAGCVAGSCLRAWVVARSTPPA